MTPRLASYLGLSLSGFHRLAYWEWGPPEAERTLVCVHGLTRQARDFDILARTFARRGWRVICPDLVGRGQSGWLAQPAGYTLLQYGADMNALLARLDVEEVDWVGNSLGGLVGMMLAAQPGTPIRRLVINDIGPYIPGTALRRLGVYLNAPPPRFADLAEAEHYIRTTLAPFGALSDDHWRHLAEHSVRADGNGGLLRHHDPGIAEAYRPWRLGSIADVGDVGQGPLPGSAPARCRLRPAAHLHRPGDDPARARGRADRVCWHRPSPRPDDA